MLRELKIFKVQAIVILEYNKRNDHKIFHSCTKPIASDSDIYEAFKFMHQSIMSKIKYCACDDQVVLDEIINHGIFDC